MSATALTAAQLAALRACGERPQSLCRRTAEPLIAAGMLRAATAVPYAFTYAPTPRGRQLLNLMALAELGQGCIDWFDDTGDCHMCEPEGDPAHGQERRHVEDCMVAECLRRMR